MIKSKDISVVVQGAVDKDYTPLCLYSIRKYLPEAEIILSTWEDSDVENLDYDILVLNKDPGGIKHDFAIYNERNSINNFNRQLVSTSHGIKKANRKYTLKLRSDLILKNVDFLKHWDKYPARNIDFNLFNHRVLCSTIYSRENSCPLTGNGLPVPFHPSDFWFFGLTEDLKNYFGNCPAQTQEEGGNWTFKYPNRLPYSSMLWRFAPEQFFCVNWVKKYYSDLNFYDWSDWNQENIELSNNILYNNFIFLDYAQSGIYSKKHEWAYENQELIQGLITNQHFQNQYKKYCDNNFKTAKSGKNYRYKLQKHFNRLLQPLRSFKSWFEEIFSVLYYLIAALFIGRKR